MIGDPNQGIYEFAGANGKFLADYGGKSGVTEYGLTRNYRSVPEILTLANQLSGRLDTAHREVPASPHGAFFIPYKAAEREKLIESFQIAVTTAGLRVEDSAVLCRGRDMANKLAGNSADVGQGLIKNFALAALHRDKQQDYLSAFKLVASSITGLLVDAPHSLVAQLSQPSRYPETRPLCRLVWGFARDAESGLPSAELPADTQWHPLLLSRLKALLSTIERECGLKPADKLGNKLAKRGLTSAPLMSPSDLGGHQATRLRIDTVHQVKGESLDAVLYMATKEHVAELLAGIGTEVGRIGYVAVTRAKNLFWLGVPYSALKELKPVLLAHGFKEIGAT